MPSLTPQITAEHVCNNLTKCAVSDVPAAAIEPVATWLNEQPATRTWCRLQGSNPRPPDYKMEGVKSAGGAKNLDD